MEGVAGGWDNIFPNDHPWGEYADHGEVWTSAFEAGSSSGDRVTLAATLERPAVDVDLDLSLLGGDRRGLRQEVRVRARDDVGPVFWASHPMLSVERGWRIDLPAADLRTDPEYSGRLPKGATLSGSQRDVALEVEPHESMFELRFAEGVGEATVGAPDGSRATRVSWDSSVLRHLWLVTISGFGPIELCLQLEPSSSHTFDLGAAVEAGTAIELSAGDERSFWVEIESLDRA
jgi:hypothetical protein